MISPGPLITDHCNSHGDVFTSKCSELTVPLPDNVIKCVALPVDATVVGMGVGVCASIDGVPVTAGTAPGATELLVSLVAVPDVPDWLV